MKRLLNGGVFLGLLLEFDFFLSLRGVTWPARFEWYNKRLCPYSTVYNQDH